MGGKTQDLGVPVRAPGHLRDAGGKERQEMVNKIHVAFLIVLLAAATAGADLTLSGGGLTLVEEGPAAANAGDAVPVNLATGAAPFASSEWGPEIGLSYHRIVNLNDGQYGNAFSWIGGNADPGPAAFAGINLGTTAVAHVQSIAFGRSNVLAGDSCGGGGVCTDRHFGLYTLQYTQASNPDASLAATGDPATGWADIGTLDYGPSSGPGTNYNDTWLRHRYNFDPVDATGIRLIGPATGPASTAIDEIELYDVAGDLVPPPPAPSVLRIDPAPGYAIGWDGNDGAFFDGIAPPAGAIVPDNVALAASGATAFSSSDLGSELSLPFHVVANANDGFYGNSNSWIGGTSNPFDPVRFVGVNLGRLVAVDRVAWGRDNGNNATDFCGGQCTDRSLGEYVLQYTTVEDPDENTAATGDAATGWETIGTFEYRGTDEAFTAYLRHEYGISTADGQPISATGLRLLVPFTGLNGGTAIDEFEVYEIPEPASLGLLALGALLLGRRV